MARVEVKLDSPEIRKLLKSNDLAEFLMGIGDAVASKAGGEYSAEISNARKSRVVVNVIDPRPEARFIEMKTGNLARALGATKK